MMQEPKINTNPLDNIKHCVSKWGKTKDIDAIKMYFYYAVSHLVDYCIELENRIKELEKNDTP